MKLHFKIFAIASAIAFTSTAFAQTTHFNSPVCIGTWATNGDLHIHESAMDEDLSGIEPYGRDLHYGDYTTTIRLTNAVTSTDATDGFVIEQKNNDVTFRQLERGKLSILGYNNRGFVIDTNGHIGIGLAPSNGMNVKIKGPVWISDTLNVNGGLNAYGTISGTYGEFRHSVQIGGMVRIGSGFECSADGQVKTKSLKVTLDGWSDFVFDDGYRLPSLSEVEQYIS